MIKEAQLFELFWPRKKLALDWRDLKTIMY